MENEEPINSIETNLIYRFPTEGIKNRINKFLGLPKSIHGNFVDNEESLWCMFSIKKTSLKRIIVYYLIASNTLLCATVFLEDAVNYQSIVHKVTPKYLSIYRWFTSPLIKK